MLGSVPVNWLELISLLAITVICPSTRRRWGGTVNSQLYQCREGADAAREHPRQLVRFQPPERNHHQLPTHAARGTNTLRVAQRTHKTLSEVRDPIPVGIVPASLFECRYLRAFKLSCPSARRGAL